MVETVFLDWLLSFGIGLLFGLFGRRTFREGRSRLASRAFAIGLAVEALLMGVSLTLYALSPDWMWMYWVDPAGLPAGIAVLAFAMYLVAFVAGFLLAPELERARRGAGWALLGVAAVSVTALELLAWNRLTHLGTFVAYQAGRAGGLAGSFKAVLAVGLPVTTLATAGALWVLARRPSGTPRTASPVATA